MFIVLFTLLGFIFLFCGVTIRGFCTEKKGRTQRGIVTMMMLPEDSEV